MAKPVTPLYFGLHALVVEPDPAVRTACRATLEALGFHVEVADSGVTAVMSVRDEIPDIVLVGRQLRDVDAKEAIHWLRVQPGMRGAPIIVIGGAADTDHLFVTPNLFVLPQPPSPAVIIMAVSKALAGNP